MPDAKLLPRRSVVAAPVPIRRGDTLRIGRHATMDLPLDDAGVSREHAVIEPDGEGWRLRDLGSANGTFVDDKRLSAPHRLSGGERVRFGPDAEYRFLVPRTVPAWRAILLSLVRWRLVPRDKSVPPQVVGGATVVVGRGDLCDLRLRVPQVSDLHARFERHAQTMWLFDTRSRNGTFVNGERVRRSAIVPGDEVAFGDVTFDVGLTARPTRRGLVALGATACALALGLALGQLDRPGGDVPVLWTRDMYEEQARASVRDAVRAYDQSPPAAGVALAQLDIAIRSLIATEKLPADAPTSEEIAAALRSVGGAAGTRDPYAVYLAARDAVREAERKEAEVPVEAPPPSDSPLDADVVVAAELGYILADFGIDTAEAPVPADLLAAVQRFVRYWSDERKGYTERTVARSRAHLPMIREQFRESRLPDVFSYLPFVESGFQTDISSPAGARGLWQFMPATGKKYGLAVTADIDERTDARLSTRAACRYVNDLLSAFGANAFMCGMAAYNKGEYGMVTCLKGVDWRSKWKFWDMVTRQDGCLKQETIDYVPKVLAAAIVLRHPALFGLSEQVGS